jgi:O-antigen/teichoic acid export membrane protein
MFLKHVASSTAAAGAVALCGLAITIVTSRVLGVSGKGQLALILNAMALVFPLTSLGLKQSTAFFVGKQHESEAGIIATHAWVAPIAALLTLLGAILVLMASGDPSPSPLVLKCIFVYALARISFDYLAGLFIARTEIYTLNILTIVRALLELTGGALGLLFAATIQTYLVGLAIGSGAAAIIAAIVVLKKHQRYLIRNEAFSEARLRYGLRLVARGLTYAMPMFVMGLNYGVDIVMLGALSSVTYVGLYSVAVTLVHALWFLPNIMNLVVFSHSVSMPVRDAPQYSKRVFRNSMKMITAMLPLIILAGFVAPTLITLAFGIEFAPAGAAFIALLPGAYFMILFKLLNGDLAARGHPNVALKTFSFALVVNVIANALLIPSYGHVGAGLASTISYTTGIILFVVAYLRITQPNA